MSKLDKLPSVSEQGPGAVYREEGDKEEDTRVCEKTLNFGNCTASSTSNSANGKVTRCTENIIGYNINSNC